MIQRDSESRCMIQNHGLETTCASVDFKSQDVIFQSSGCTETLHNHTQPAQKRPQTWSEGVRVVADGLPAHHRLAARSTLDRSQVREYLIRHVAQPERVHVWSCTEQGRLSRV